MTAPTPEKPAKKRYSRFVASMIGIAECLKCGSRRRLRGRYCTKIGCNPGPIEKWRDRRRMSVAELCRRAGITPSTLHRIAAGQHVSEKSLAAVARVTRIPLEKLRGDPTP